MIRANPTGRNVVIARSYHLHEASCTEAINLLLKKRGRLPDKSGPDDASRKDQDADTKSYCT
jgi:hypothetical protein